MSSLMKYVVANRLLTRGLWVILALLYPWSMVLAKGERGCKDPRPVLEFEFRVDQAQGSIDPIILARSPDALDKPSKVKLFTSWETLLDSSVEFNLEFFYDAALSIEYPIFALQVDQTIIDFSKNCTEPKGRELFAGGRLRVPKIVEFLNPNQTARVKVRIWGGVY